MHDLLDEDLDGTSLLHSLLVVVSEKLGRQYFGTLMATQIGPIFFQFAAAKGLRHIQMFLGCLAHWK